MCISGFFKAPGRGICGTNQQGKPWWRDAGRDPESAGRTIGVCFKSGLGEERWKESRETGREGRKWGGMGEGYDSIALRASDGWSGAKFTHKCLVFP